MGATGGTEIRALSRYGVTRLATAGCTGLNQGTGIETGLGWAADRQAKYCPQNVWLELLMSMEGFWVLTELCVSLLMCSVPLE